MNFLQNRLAEKKQANEESGFTLIELLVVIVILGILAAVVVFSVRGITDRGNKSACEATRTAILTGSEAAVAQDGAFPASLTAMAAAGYLTAGGGTITASDFLGKGFVVRYTPGTVTPAPGTAATALAAATTAGPFGACP
jgi:prepilin-type N-terminal cleavage/methylation domain-containing protein